MKKIIFDLDDTLWNLNAKACALADVDVNKLVIFNMYKNKNLTKDEVNKLYDIYCDPNLWKDIKYHRGVKSIAQLEKYKGVKVFINSNCMNDDVCTYKRSFLSKDLKLPDKQIHLNNSCKKKEITDAFIFIDDNPENILHAKSKYYIVPDKPWNQNLKGENIYRCYSFAEIVKTIEKILKEEKICKR